MKLLNWVICALLFVSLGQHAQAQVDTQLGVANHGGIDGGGGGTLPAHPATVDEIVDELQNSKLYLRLAFRSYEKYASRSTALDNKIIFGPTNILSLLESVRLDVQVDKPCFDRNLIQVDASVVDINSNTICLSAFRIAPKLESGRISAQLNALLAHELSHFLGTTEVEATFFQTVILKQLNSVSNDQIERHLSDLVNTVFLIRSTHLEQLKTDPANFKNFFGLSSDFRVLKSQIAGLDISALALDQRQSDYLQVMQARALVLMLKHQDDAYSRSILERLFNNGTTATVTYQKFWEKFSPWGIRDHFNFKDAAIFYPTDARVMKQIAVQMQDELIQLEEYLKSIRDRQSLPNLWQFVGLPLQHNPWERFLGEFETKESVCTVNNQASNVIFHSFSIIKVGYPNHSWPALRRVGNGFSADLSLDFSSGKISGDSNSATLFQESGDSWKRYGNYEQARYEIRKIDTGDFILEINNFQKTGYSDPQRTYDLNCTYRLSLKH